MQQQQQQHGVYPQNYTGWAAGPNPGGALYAQGNAARAQALMNGAAEEESRGWEWIKRAGPLVSWILLILIIVLMSIDLGRDSKVMNEIANGGGNGNGNDNGNGNGNGNGNDTNDTEMPSVDCDDGNPCTADLMRGNNSWCVSRPLKNDIPCTSPCLELSLPSSCLRGECVGRCVGECPNKTGEDCPSLQLAEGINYTVPVFQKNLGELDADFCTFGVCVYFFVPDPPNALPFHELFSSPSFPVPHAFLTSVNVHASMNRARAQGCMDLISKNETRRDCLNSVAAFSSGRDFCLYTFSCAESNFVEGNVTVLPAEWETILQQVGQGGS